MQAFFSEDEAAIKAFRATISEARFSRYMRESNSDPALAIQLYHWNALLSQAMYLPLQMWEVALRNKLNVFLIQKYNKSWPYDERALRDFAGKENRRLQETKDRLDPQRRTVKIATDAIVADLSAGFWVSLLTRSYEVPFTWRYNLARIFPQGGPHDRATLNTVCDRLLVLRNRVAHHEPIFQLPLGDRKLELDAITAAMCKSASIYVQSTCTFNAIWTNRPQAATTQPANDHSPQASLGAAPSPP